MRRPAALLIYLLEVRSVVSADRSWDGAPCREWSRASNAAGYGRLWDGERLQYTHRLSYEMSVGPIPAGLDVLHRCDNPRCVEARHLWVGTHAENMADRDVKGRGRSGGHLLAGRRSAQRGERHRLSKLTEAQAREIKGRLQAKESRPVFLAREYGVSASLIRSIERGRSWGWLATEGFDPRTVAAVVEES